GTRAASAKDRSQGILSGSEATMGKRQIQKRKETTMNEATTLQQTGNGTATSSWPSVWFTPRFDIYENENEYVLLGDLPGVNPSNLDVKYENQELTIHGRVPQ